MVLQGGVSLWGHLGALPGTFCSQEPRNDRAAKECLGGKEPATSQCRHSDVCGLETIKSNLLLAAFNPVHEGFVSELTA